MYSLALAICFLPFATAQYGAPPPSQSSSAAAPAPTAPTDTPGHMNVNLSNFQVIRPNDLLTRLMFFSTVLSYIILRILLLPTAPLLLFGSLG